MSIPNQYQIAVEQGQLIFDQDEPGTEMFLIQQGTVEIVRREEGEEVVLATLGAGNFFGEIGILLDGHPRTAAARAKTDCRCLKVDRSTFEELIRGDTSIAIRVMRRLALRLRNQAVDMDAQVDDE